MRGLTLCHGAFEKKRRNKQAHHEGFKNQKGAEHSLCALMRTNLTKSVPSKFGTKTSQSRQGQTEQGSCGTAVRSRYWGAIEDENMAQAVLCCHCRNSGNVITPLRPAPYQTVAAIIRAVVLPKNVQIAIRTEVDCLPILLHLGTVKLSSVTSVGHGERNRRRGLYAVRDEISSMRDPSFIAPIVAVRSGIGWASRISI